MVLVPTATPPAIEHHRHAGGGIGISFSTVSSFPDWAQRTARLSPLTGRSTAVVSPGQAGLSNVGTRIGVLMKFLRRDRGIPTADTVPVSVVATTERGVHAVVTPGAHYRETSSCRPRSAWLTGGTLRCPCGLGRKRLGVSRSRFYRHFDKAALLGDIARSGGLPSRLPGPRERRIGRRGGSTDERGP